MCTTDRFQTACRSSVNCLGYRADRWQWTGRQFWGSHGTFSPVWLLQDIIAVQITYLLHLKSYHRYLFVAIVRSAGLAREGYPPFGDHSYR